MGCLLKRILLCLQKNKNNQIHPIDERDYVSEIHDLESQYHFSENINQSNNRNRINNHHEDYNHNDENLYEGLTTGEIISLINVIDGNSSRVINRPNTTSSVITNTIGKKKKKKSNKTCPICLEKIKSDDTVPKIVCKNKKCRGCYHKNCIEEWAKTKMTNDIACLLCTLKTIKVSANQSQSRRNTTIQYNPYIYNNNYSIYNNRNNNNNLGRGNYYNVINSENRYGRNSYNRINNSNYDINYSIYSNNNRTLNTR